MIKFTKNKNLQKKLIAIFSIICISSIFLLTIPVPVKAAFEDSILFKFGGENSNLNGWNLVGPHGSGDRSGSYVQVDNTHVRTGNQAIKFYQVSPVKSDAQRRVELRHFNTAKELYVSWWAYFPSGQNWEDQDVAGWGTALGGWQLFFGPPELSYKWWTSGRFVIQNNRNFQFNYDWGAFSSSANAIKKAYNTPYNIGDYLDQWVHFQVYVKWAKDNTGIVRAWFNDNLVAEATGIKTNPEGYNEWKSNYVYCFNEPYPFIVIEYYCSENSPKGWYWVDDVIGATAKVPETYRAVGK